MSAFPGLQSIGLNSAKTAVSLQPTFRDALDSYPHDGLTGFRKTVSLLEIANPRFRLTFRTVV
jgi:hypothetical protein